jgi:hypothetical protein
MARVVLNLCLALSLLGCASSSPIRDQAGMAAVHRYVSTHKHWKHSDYHIDGASTSGRLFVYHVVFLADADATSPGGGRSFEAYYDPQIHTVVKPLYFE